MLSKAERGELANFQAITSMHLEIRISMHLGWHLGLTHVLSSSCFPNLRLSFLFKCMCMCVHTCSSAYAHVCVGAHRDQKTSDSLDLELQGVASHLMWVLELNPGLPAEVHALSC